MVDEVALAVEETKARLLKEDTLHLAPWVPSEDDLALEARELADQRYWDEMAEYWRLYRDRDEAIERASYEAFCLKEREKYLDELYSIQAEWDF